MKVKDLREILTMLPDDYEVILQKDAEGNGFSPASGAGAGEYEAESTWSGEVLHPADQTGPDNCVVIWPVN